MVDLTSFAVLRSVANIGVVDSEIEALVDIGARVTNIVVHSGGVPHFVRILLMGGQDVTDAVASNLGVTHEQAEALKQELGGGSTVRQRGRGRPGRGRHGGHPGRRDPRARSTTTAPRPRTGRSSGSCSPAAARACAAWSTGWPRPPGCPVVVGDPLGSLHLGRTGLSDDQVRHVQHLAAVPVGLALGAAS